MDRWVADLGYCLLQVDTSEVLANVSRLKGELPAQTNIIIRNVSWGQSAAFEPNMECLPQASPPAHL